VHFSYTDASHALLQGIDCHIAQNEYIAFVGLSGSGKSTLLKLLLGFYIPQHGKITINGIALSQLDLAMFRKHIGVVLQDDQLMPGSILENIIGYSNALESDVRHILQQLNMIDFIDSLPMGINTLASTALPLFSGGQKQLLLIARALISKPQLLLLDEATNSLDNPTQELISKCINQLNITRISIAHRLSTVRHADKIYVLEHGVISQVGTYQQLIQQEGLFSQLAKSQDFGIQ
jgi:ATP-binding cassette subfamily C protein